jgi:hypothetical protein
MTCNQFCTPVLIYLGLGFFTIMMILLRQDLPVDRKIILILQQSLAILLWTSVMMSFCYYCKERWAWYVLIGMFVFGLLLIFFLAFGVGYGLSTGKIRLH